MPILYPASLDSLTNPTSSDTLAGVPHATQHSDENDAIEALETKVGTGASTPATPGHVLRVSGPGATAYSAILEGDIPAAIARTSDVTSAVAAHEADTTNVHGIADATVLATDAEVAAAVAAHAAAVDPHPTYATDAALTAAIEALELDYAQITSDVVISATTGATANTCITGSAVVYDGSTVIQIEVYSHRIRPDNTAGRSLVIVLYDGSTQLGVLGQVQSFGLNSDYPFSASVRLTPSAASHTYSVRAYVSAGSGLFQAGTGATGAGMPASMRITRVP